MNDVIHEQQGQIEKYLFGFLLGYSMRAFALGGVAWIPVKAFN